MRIVVHENVYFILYLSAFLIDIWTCNANFNYKVIIMQIDIRNR